MESTPVSQSTSMVLRHVVLDFKEKRPERKSQAHYQTEYRDRLKSNPQQWQEYKKRQKIHMRKYLDSLSEEQRLLRKERRAQLQRDYRKAKKQAKESAAATPSSSLVSEPVKKKTRKAVQDERAYWRERKRAQRASMSADVRKAVAERENERRRKKRKLLSTSSAVCSSNSPVELNSIRTPLASSTPNRTQEPINDHRPLNFFEPLASSTPNETQTGGTTNAQKQVSFRVPLTSATFNITQPTVPIERPVICPADESSPELQNSSISINSVQHSPSPSKCAKYSALSRCLHGSNELCTTTAVPNFVEVDKFQKDCALQENVLSIENDGCERNDEEKGIKTKRVCGGTVVQIHNDSNDDSVEDVQSQRVDDDGSEGNEVENGCKRDYGGAVVQIHNDSNDDSDENVQRADDDGSEGNEVENGCKGDYGGAVVQIHNDSDDGTQESGEVDDCQEDGIGYGKKDFDLGEIEKSPSSRDCPGEDFVNDTVRESDHDKRKDIDKDILANDDAFLGASHMSKIIAEFARKLDKNHKAVFVVFKREIWNWVGSEQEVRISPTLILQPWLNSSFDNPFK
ncbi:hypothetical protein ElyMa_006412100 [Elysia marginata]|uniref:HMG box domain-containing protein n=1 Tax=Elysia marginata TaxID=1093978 RepID=A0AAV4HTR9_9GAST|nr:hypothetical protein ElyMa_006412100 [Elysia marginata]